MMRIVDILIAIPFMFVLILLLVMFGRSMFDDLRRHRADVMAWHGADRTRPDDSLKHKEYIEAARATGVPAWKIIFRHIVPNLLGIVAVYATLLVPDMILTGKLHQLPGPWRAGTPDLTGRADRKGV
jgi:oligopeptide transport system permease protein